MGLRSKRAEIYTGLFVIAGLTVLGWLVSQLGQYGKRQGGSYSLAIDVSDATGIREGVPVRVGGVDIGMVASDPELSDDFSGIEVVLSIDENRKIPAGSAVIVATSGLMGDSFIRIDPPANPTGVFLQPDDRIEAQSATSINDMTALAGETFTRIAAATEELQESLVRVDAVFEKIDESVLIAENTDNLRLLLSELRQSSELIHEAAGKIDPVLEETNSAMLEVRAAAEGVNETFNTLTDSAERFTGSLDLVDPVVIELDSTIDLLRDTLAEANSMINKIENGNGFASVLINDPELKNDLQSFVDKLEGNGVLFYPRENGLFKKKDREEQPRAAAKQIEPESKAEKKGPFSWLKKKK